MKDIYRMGIVYTTNPENSAGNIYTLYSDYAANLKSAKMLIDFQLIKLFNKLNELFPSKKFTIVEMDDNIGFNLWYVIENKMCKPYAIYFIVEINCFLASDNKYFYSSAYIRFIDNKIYIYEQGIGTDIINTVDYDPKNISNGLLEALDYIDYYFYGNQELYRWFEKRFYILKPGNKDFDNCVNGLLDFIKNKSG